MTVPAGKWQSGADRAVVDDRLGLPQFERQELIDEDSSLR